MAPDHDDGDGDVRAARPRRRAPAAAAVGTAALALALGGTSLVAAAPADERAAALAALRGDPVAAVLGGSPSAVARPPVVPARPDGPTAAARVTSTDAEAPRVARPQRLRIPAIAVDAPVDGVGLLPDRTLEVPDDTSLVGWYDRFPRPGEAGVSVLVGHVDSRSGPGVFVDLATLTPGDDVEVVTRDDEVVRYRVTAVDRHRKVGFPTREVFGDDRDEVLRLITCGGAFDPAAGGYVDNVVVTALPVEDR
ncbi:class F sortase [Nitriliruptoraceae bacterium ZYF776]|nr:class F sortase [Profundirhabdus halotolerans]